MASKSSESKQRYDKAYNARPEQKKNRAKRNKMRRQAIKDNRVSVGDNTDIDHKKKLANGGGNTKKNTRVRDRSANRADNLGRGGRKKKGKK